MANDRWPMTDEQEPRNDGQGPKNEDQGARSKNQRMTEERWRFASIRLVIDHWPSVISSYGTETFGVPVNV